MSDLRERLVEQVAAHLLRLDKPSVQRTLDGALGEKFRHQAKVVVDAILAVLSSEQASPPRCRDQNVMVGSSVYEPAIVTLNADRMLFIEFEASDLDDITVDLHPFLAAGPVVVRDSGEPVDGETIGERIRHLRKARGVAQAEVAEWMGAPRPAVSLVEGGSRKVSAEELDAIARGFGVSPLVLLGRVPDSGERLSEEEREIVHLDVCPECGVADSGHLLDPPPHHPCRIERECWVPAEFVRLERDASVSPSPSSPPEREARVVFESQEDDVCEECGAGKVVIRKLIELPPSSPAPSAEEREPNLLEADAMAFSRAETMAKWERERDEARARVSELENAARALARMVRDEIPDDVSLAEGVSTWGHGTEEEVAAVRHIERALLSDTEGGKR